MRFLRSLAAAGLVAACAAAAVAAPVQMMPAQTESPTPAVGGDMGPSNLRVAPARSPLPDSVLARLYFSATSTADLTRRQFVEAVQQLRIPGEALTPALRGQVLELMLQKRILSRRALREPRDWNHADSVSYTGLRDRLTLSAALDSAMAELGFHLMQHGDTLPDRQVMGMMLRDSAVATLHPVYDEPALALVAKAFESLPRTRPGMSIAEQIQAQMQMPSVSAADSARRLIHSDLGDYTVGQLLAEFGKLNPSYRPQVRTAEQVRDVANSVIYEALLRRHIEAQGIERKPAIAAALAERAEFLDVQSYLRKATYMKVATDSVTLRRHFERHPRWFDTWAGAEILRGVLPTRAQADSLAKLMVTPGLADSLRGQAMPNGLRYATFLQEQADTALFARVRRAGTRRVVGPDETEDGWRVIRALKIEPRRPRTFEEARDIVYKDWYQRDGDRRVKELMRSLEAGCLVQTNDAALAKVTVPAPRRAPGSVRMGTR